MTTAEPTITIAGKLTVSRLGFGAGRITGHGYWGPPHDTATAIQVLRTALDRGVNLIDTADNYGPAISEELIADALHPYPAELVIATKGGVVRTAPDTWHCAGRPDQLREACEHSLRRLRLDSIPIYQLHRIDPDVALAEQIGALADLRTEGKIQHIGLDTITADELEAARGICPVATVQNKYNLFSRECPDVLRTCEQDGIAYLPYLPLAGGSLTGAQSAPSVLTRIAASHNATNGQVALAWLLHTSPVTVPTPGTADPAHLQENLGSSAINLSAEEVDSLETLTATSTYASATRT